MTQTPTEKRPPFKWLIPVQTNGKGSFGRPELVRACRGSEDMAIELNYFAYEASSEAQNKNIDVEQVDYIRITRSQDAIMQGILHCVSKKTHIDHRRKFEEWGFLVADVYHQTYDIYFKKIAEAIENPPALEKRKPRGKHVKKVKTTNSDVKTTNSQFDPSNLPNCSFNPYEEIVKLQNQIVNLQNEFSNLQNQIVNLQNAQSSNSAPQASSEVFENPLDSNRLLEILRDKYTVVLQNDDAFTLPVLEVATAVTDTTFKIAVLDDWREAHTTNQPELSTPDTANVDNSPEQVATCNPIATDTPQPTQNENGSHEQPASGKKPRTPAQPLDETTKARVERVFSYFDKLKQEMTGDSEAKYVRTKTAISEVKDTLLPCAPTEQRLRKVYMALWNTPRDARSGFEWKKNMTIKAVCGQYEARVIDIIAEEKREAEKKRDQERYMSPTPPIAPVEDDLPFDIERVRANRRRIGNRQVV